MMDWGHCLGLTSSPIFQHLTTPSFPPSGLWGRWRSTGHKGTGGAQQGPAKSLHAAGMAGWAQCPPGDVLPAEQRCPNARRRAAPQPGCHSIKTPFAGHSASPIPKGSSAWTLRDCSPCMVRGAGCCHCCGNGGSPGRAALSPCHGSRMLGMQPPKAWEAEIAVGHVGKMLEHFTWFGLGLPLFLPFLNWPSVSLSAGPACHQQ